MDFFCWNFLKFKLKIRLLALLLQLCVNRETLIIDCANSISKRREGFGLPKASRIVLASKICCWTQVEMLAVTEHKYSRMNLVFSVFPAPDSPDMTKLWLTLSI